MSLSKKIANAIASFAINRLGATDYTKAVILPIFPKTLIQYKWEEYHPVELCTTFDLPNDFSESWKSSPQYSSKESFILDNLARKIAASPRFKEAICLENRIGVGLNKEVYYANIAMMPSSYFENKVTWLPNC